MTRGRKRAPPQAPPGGPEQAVTLEQVYESRPWPDEDESIWGREPRTDVAFAVVKFDPSAAMRWLMWDGRRVADHAADIHDPGLVRAYASDAADGVWLGYPVIHSGAFGEATQLLDGTHRVSAMALAGVREAHAVDVATRSHGDLGARIASFAASSGAEGRWGGVAFAVAIARWLGRSAELVGALGEAVGGGVELRHAFARIDGAYYDASGGSGRDEAEARWGRGGGRSWFRPFTAGEYARAVARLPAGGTEAALRELRSTVGDPPAWSAHVEASRGWVTMACELGSGEDAARVAAELSSRAAHPEVEVAEAEGRAVGVVCRRLYAYGVRSAMRDAGASCSEVERDYVSAAPRPSGGPA